jgi:hypothetical protein
MSGAASPQLSHQVETLLERCGAASDVALEVAGVEL